ncbi:MAG TPA: hypothetical protein VGO11_18560 [Chthoniobacteraceae bacterium]|nr:hypothetical protein [Chthoniobacteraceae bacterium]
MPGTLPLVLATRFQTALTLLLKRFASQPTAWPAGEVEQLLALADALGTRAMPGREPWDLGLEFSLKPLVESRPADFDALPIRLRLNTLALLGANPCTLPGEFWQRLYDRDPEYRPAAWRGMLRCDWSRACRCLSTYPPSETALRPLVHHARYAMQRIQKDESGHLRLQFSQGLGAAHGRVRQVIEREAERLGSGVFAQPVSFLPNEGWSDLVCFWLRLSLGEDKALRDERGELVSAACLANLEQILRTTFTDPKLATYTAAEKFGWAETRLRMRYAEPAPELKLLDFATSPEALAEAARHLHAPELKMLDFATGPKKERVPERVATGGMAEPLNRQVRSILAAIAA